MPPDSDGAGVVDDRRSFTSGRREPIARIFLDQLGTQDRKQHDYVMALRDKHIAHSVNAFEDTQVGTVDWTGPQL